MVEDVSVFLSYDKHVYFKFWGVYNVNITKRKDRKSFSARLDVLFFPVTTGTRANNYMLGSYRSYVRKVPSLHPSLSYIII
jgi:hypothetical protein